jgi:hypothetical protein
LREAIDTQRRTNFIARSTANDLHSVLIKAVDQAGNERVVEWTFRLALYSSDISVSCGFHQIMRDAKLANGFPIALWSRAGKPLFFANMVLDATAPDQSLTPNNGSQEFELPNMTFEWKAEEAMMQIATLGYEHPGSSMWSKCHRDNDHWWLMFDDGECQRNNGKSNPRSWIRPFGNDQVFHQTAEPHARSISLSHHEGRTSAGTWVDSTDRFDRASDGRPVTLDLYAQTVSGEIWPQFSYRIGWEWKSMSEGKPRKLDERAFIKVLRISQTAPFRPIYKGAVDAPPPGHIAYDQGCNEARSLVWAYDQPARWGD